jgi:acetolactate synthase-1/2/3 large subunit
MKASGANIIATLIEREGVDTVFGIPGGANLPIYDALASSPLRHILPRHEQGGGFMAQGMARSTGRTAVCMATSGPGATNLVTAIADAKLDSVPIVAVTGQVGLSVLGTDAFQEIDTYGMTQSITKHNVLARSAGELLDIVPEAFRIARSGRPGPVLIDVPKDVQTQEAEFDAWPEPSRADPMPEPDPQAIHDLARMINEAERPFAYFGGGVAMGGAWDALRSFLACAGIPSACTLTALGCLPQGEPGFLGMLGMHGSEAANRVAEAADLVIAIGARFDDRVTGRADSFLRRAAIAHIDADAAEINKIRRVNLSVLADAGKALDGLTPLVIPRQRPEWAAFVERERERGGYVFPDDSGHPASVIREVARLAGPEAIAATDVGQHQMWAAQAYPAMRPRSFLTSAGLGTMGFGLPAAIGAALANPGRKTLLFTGDGSLMMNVQELATLAELNLDLCVILFDNGHLGLVRQQQELFYGKRFMATRFDMRMDFRAIARGFGIESAKVELGRDPGPALAEAISAKGPRFLQVEVDPEELVLPMVPPGKSNLEAITEGSLARR